MTALHRKVRYTVGTVVTEEILLSRGVPLSGDATPGHARSNDLAGRSTALAPTLCFGNSVNRN